MEKIEKYIYNLIEISLVVSFIVGLIIALIFDDKYFFNVVCILIIGIYWILLIHYRAQNFLKFD